MWKYSANNSYPDIILHDCIIENVRTIKGNLVFSFDDSGFWINKDNPHNPFGQILRTGKAELKLVNTDMDDISINLFEKVRFLNKTAFTKLKNISIKDFASKLNSREWRFEFVDEYYAYHHAMFCGYIRLEKKPYFIYAQIEVTYDECIYYWNQIFEDRVW